MRSLGQFIHTKHPCIALVLYNKTTHLPTAALFSEHIKGYSNPPATVLVEGTSVPVHAVIEQATYNERRANNGGGINDATFSVTIRHSEPFNVSVWSKLFYSVGTNIESLYIKAFAVNGDGLLTSSELLNHCFIGIFRFSSDVSWSEDSIVTSFTIQSILKLLDDKVSEIDDATIQSLEVSDWLGLKDLPLYIGHWNKVRAAGKVRLYGGATSAFTKSKILYSKSGYIKDNWTSGTLKIGGVPGEVFYNNNLGESIKVILDDGETVSGTLVDLGVDGYGLSGVSRNVALQEVTCRRALLSYSATLTGSPGGLSSITYGYCYDTFRASGACLVADTGYLTQPQTWTDGNYTCMTRVDAYVDTVNTTVSATNTGHQVSTVEETLLYYRVSGRSMYPNNPGSGETLDLAGPNMIEPTVLSMAPAPPGNVEANANNGLCYFRLVPYTFVAPATISAGRGFTIIKGATCTGLNTGLSANTSEQYAYYFRSKFSTVNNARVFANIDGKLLKIPASRYSVSYNQTFLGLSNLTKILLNTDLATIFPPVEEAGPNNSLVTRDRTINYEYLAVDIEAPSKFRWLVNKLATFDPLLTSLLHADLATPPTENDANSNLEFGPKLSLKITNQTTTQILDTLCFEAGQHLIFKAGKIGYEQLVRQEHVPLSWTDSGSVFYKESFNEQYIQSHRILKSECLVKTPTITVGKAINYLNSYSQEYIKVNGNFTIPYEELNAINATLRNKYGTGKKDRDYSYSFQHINTRADAELSATNLASLGSTSSLAETNRVYSIAGIYELLRFTAGAAAHLVDFPFVSDTAAGGELNLVEWYYDSLGIAYHKVATEKYRTVPPNLTVVDSISIDFHPTAQPAKLSLRQSAVYANISLRYSADLSELALPSTSGGTPSGPTVEVPNTGGCASTGSNDGDVIIGADAGPQSSGCSPCGGGYGGASASTPSGDRYTVPCDDPNYDYDLECYSAFHITFDDTSCSSCTYLYDAGATCQINDASAATNNVDLDQGLGYLGDACCTQIISATVDAAYLAANDLSPTDISVTVNTSTFCGTDTPPFTNAITVSINPAFFTEDSPDSVSVPIVVRYTRTLSAYLEDPSSVFNYDEFTATVPFCIAALPAAIIS